MEQVAAKLAPSLALRLFVTACLVLYLLAAWGSGFDRLSATLPALERLVPGPLRAQADRSAATIALARGNAATALERAAHAVRNDSLDPLSTSLLGSARQYRRDGRGAEAAFRIAAARGWRDRLTQLYWYDAALGAGEVERAALRADALLRADPEFAAAGQLLAPLEASAKGRTALARRLAGNPSWAAAYLKVSADIDAKHVGLKGEIALLAARQGEALRCDNSRGLVAVLVERGMRREAERLWRAACGSDALGGEAENGLADGGFEQLAAASAASPFGWRKYARGDVFIESVAGEASGSALSLRNSASVSRIVLSQALALAPGLYRVRAKIRPARGAVAISLACGAEARRPELVRGDPAASGQLLEIGACENQVLGLWLRPGTGEVTIDDVAIERVR